MYSYREYNNDDIRDTDFNKRVEYVINKLILPDAHDRIKLLSIPPYRDTTMLVSIAEYIKEHFTKVVVIGMGGAVLNPMSITALKHHNSFPEVVYLDTVDPELVLELLDNIVLAETAFLVISKSGNSIETIALLSLVLQKYHTQYHDDIKQHFYFIIGKEGGILRESAEQIGCTILEHEEICGRYATFTACGLLPALISGLDIKALCRGAEYTIRCILSQGVLSAVAQSATFMLDMYKQKKRTSVYISYTPKLVNFTKWQSQIIAESIGQNRRGITPLTAIGLQDHHTQMQLYLGGPADKLYTLLYIKPKRNLALVFNNSAPQILIGKEMSDVLETGYNIALSLLIKAGLPVRTITADNLNEEVLGAVMMHTMVESIIVSLVLGITPFAQPDIEHIKQGIISALMGQ